MTVATWSRLVTTILAMLVAQHVCIIANDLSFMNSGRESSDTSQCPEGKQVYTKGMSYLSKVYEAKDNGSDFVIKESNIHARRLVGDESTTELSIMRAVSKCPGVLHMLEESPCVYNGTDARIVDGFVMPKMHGTFDDIDMERIKNPVCAQKTIQTLAQALSCVHGEGYVHMDMHYGNLFFFGESDCPKVRLGDFDVAVHKSADVDGLFPTQGYENAVHRPEWVFKEYSTNAAIHKAVDVDWCSLLVLAKDLDLDVSSGDFHQILKEQICKDHGEDPCQLDCGSMGIFPRGRSDQISFSAHP